MMLMWSFVAAQAAPDLVVSSISAGCTGSRGDPTIVVTVRNVGTTAAGSFWVDLFRDLPMAPPIGEIGEDAFRVSTGLAAGASLTRSFTLAGEEGWSGWVDILVDTDRIVAESNENNNHRERSLALLDCSFN